MGHHLVYIIKQTIQLLVLLGTPDLGHLHMKKNRGLKQVVGLRERNQYQTKGANGTHEKELHRNNFQHFLV